MVSNQMCIRDRGEGTGAVAAMPLLDMARAVYTVSYTHLRNIGREGQQHRLLTLARLRDEQVDMFTTVFIGAGTTQAVAGRMVTPRGYEAKR